MSEQSKPSTAKASDQLKPRTTKASDDAELIRWWSHKQMTHLQTGGGTCKSTYGSRQKSELHTSISENDLVRELKRLKPNIKCQECGEMVDTNAKTTHFTPDGRTIPPLDGKRFYIKPQSDWLGVSVFDLRKIHDRRGTNQSRDSGSQQTGTDATGGAGGADPDDIPVEIVE